MVKLNAVSVLVVVVSILSLIGCGGTKASADATPAPTSKGSADATLVPPPVVTGSAAPSPAPVPTTTTAPIPVVLPTPPDWVINNPSLTGKCEALGSLRNSVVFYGRDPVTNEHIVLRGCNNRVWQTEPIGSYVVEGNLLRMGIGTGGRQTCGAVKPWDTGTVPMSADEWEGATVVKEARYKRPSGNHGALPNYQVVVMNACANDFNPAPPPPPPVATVAPIPPKPMGCGGSCFKAAPATTTYNTYNTYVTPPSASVVPPTITAPPGPTPGDARPGFPGK